jgi:hypothetical protein
MDLALFAHLLLVELGHCIMNGIVTSMMAQAQAAQAAQAAPVVVLRQQILTTNLLQKVINQTITEMGKLERILVDIVALAPCHILSLALPLQQ